jgi:dipeptidyl aminopeptidase/acylaminoacyl peptidase
MKNILLLLFVSYAIFANAQRKEAGSLVMENIPDVPTELIEQMTRYQNTRAAGFLGWNPAGEAMLITTRFGETNQLHIVNQPMGARKQITFFKEPVTSASFCPDPNYPGFMFRKDVGGNEFAQLYWYELLSGKYFMVSDGGRTQNGSPLWSNKGDRFIYTSTRRNLKDYDLYLSSMTGPAHAKMILEVKGSWNAMDWSPDDKKVLVRNYISINSSKIFILDIESGKLDEINTSTETIAYNDAAWSADGKGIFVISDEGSEFQVLKYYDLAAKKFKAITFSMKWDVDGFTMNKKRDQIVFVANENGIDRLYQMNTTTMKYTPLPGIPTGLVSGLRFKEDGKEIGFSISTAQSPGDAYSFNLTTNTLRRWTDSEVGGLDNTKFPVGVLIEYRTFDQAGSGPRMIPAFIYKPANAKGKMPVVINIHGGPEGQSRPSFSSFTTFLNNELGVAVIQPNVRGSSGYGKNYLKLDNGYKREESVEDIGKLLDWIKTQPDLDPERVAVMGGSYGGYMTLASMTHFNDRLRCGIDVVGISNFVTFLKNTEDYRKDLRRVEYGDERDSTMKQFLEKISPLNNVQKITKPMLIVQGANDPRVPMSEAEQMKTKLSEKGVETWYLLAKDEGHGFRKKANVDYYQWAVVMFLKKYLL